MSEVQPKPTTRVRPRQNGQVGLMLGNVEHMFTAEEARALATELTTLESATRTTGEETAIALVRAQCAFELAQARRIEAWRAEQKAGEVVKAAVKAREEWERGQITSAQASAECIHDYNHRSPKANSGD